MPDGRMHDGITLVAASFATPICFGLVFGGEPGRAALFLGSYLISGLLFSDDLDIDSIEYKRWRVLRFLWWPYQKLVPHRSWLSHGLIIGPLLRIVYFAGMCTLLLWLLLTALSRVLPLDAHGLMGDVLGAIGRSILDHPDWWGIAFLGFILGSVTHITADWMWTFWRRALRAPARPVAAAAAAETPTHHGMPVPDYAVRITYNVPDPQTPSPLQGEGTHAPSPQRGKGP